MRSELGAAEAIRLAYTHNLAAMGEGAQVIDPDSFARFRPYLARFFPVFCAFSPSRRGGSNGPQAGTQGQEFSLAEMASCCLDIIIRFNCGN